MSKSNGVNQPTNGATQGPKRGRPRKAKPLIEGPIADLVDEPKVRRTRAHKLTGAEPVAPKLDTRQLAKVGSRAKKIAELEATIARAQGQLAAELAGLKSDLQDAPVAREARKPRVSRQQTLPFVDARLSDGGLED